jgi:hypothetical protein
MITNDHLCQYNLYLRGLYILLVEDGQWEKALTKFMRSLTDYKTQNNSIALRTLLRVRQIIEM